MEFNHPGGRHVLVDDINVFNSVHPNPKYKKLLSKYNFKFTESSIYNFDTPFAEDVKKLNFKNSHKAPFIWWIRFAMLNAALVYTECSYLKYPTFLNSICLGIVYAGLGLCIGHDGSHGAVGNKYANEFCSYYMDFIGNTNYSWHSQHITKHHPYTNEITLDPDVTAGDPFIIYDGKEGVKSPKVAILSVIMLGPILAYDIRKLWAVNKYTLPRNVIISLILRLYLYYKLLYHSLVYGQIVIVVAGAILGILFAVSHNSIHVSRNMLKCGNDWYKNQIESSCTYGGAVSGFLTGGLNYQIEHHVFPHMNSCYYPQLTEKMKEICKQHDVKFVHYNTYIENFRNYLKLFL